MRPADRPLALVAAALGFAGSVILSCIWLNGYRQAPASVLLVVTTTIVAGGLGHVASHRISSPMGFAGATLVAGAVNGAILGAIAGLALEKVATILILPALGAIFGIVCAMPFVPALTIAFKASRRVGRARAGSLVDEADRRAPWTATCVTVLMGGMLVALLFPVARQPTLFALLFGAGVVAIFLAGQTARSWHRARGWQLAFASAVPREDTSVEVPEGAETFDFGVGEDEHDLRQRGDAYRTGVRTKARLRGDAALTRSILRRDLALGILGTLLCALATVSIIAMPLTDDPRDHELATVPFD